VPSQVVIDGDVATALLDVSLSSGTVPDGLTSPTSDAEIARIEKARVQLSKVVREAFDSPDVRVESLSFSSTGGSNATARVLVTTVGRAVIGWLDHAAGKAALKGELDDAVVACVGDAVPSTKVEITKRDVVDGEGLLNATQLDGGGGSGSTLTDDEKLAARIIAGVGLAAVFILVALWHWTSVI
jgi:hypothetical protein